MRSPLARLQAAAGLLRQDPGKLAASLERIEREIARLDALVGELLELARLEAGNGKSSGGAFDFADLVAAVVEDARFEAEAAGRKVSFQGAGEMMMSGRGDLLHRAVENVLRNAVKYSAPNFSSMWVLVQRGESVPSEGHAVDHVGWRVTDLNAKVAELKAKGVKVTSEPRPLKLANGTTIYYAYVEGPAGTKIELVQR